MSTSMILIFIGFISAGVVIGLAVGFDLGFRRGLVQKREYFLKED